MPTIASVAAALVMLAGCTASTTPVQGRPPVAQLALSQLPQQPAHGDERPLLRPSDPDGPDDPAAVAAAVILAGLAEEQREVVDLGIETIQAASQAVTLLVAATHRSGLEAAPHTSVYELDVTRHPDGSWRLASFRQVQ